MPSVVMLTVVMLSGVMLNVVAPVGLVCVMYFQFVKQMFVLNSTF
jgi:hypothetical protein